MVASGIVIVPVVVMGLILAFLEMIFIHQDEAGLGWLKHGLHAIPTMFVFIFISMNVPLVESMLGISDKMWIVISIRVVIGLVAIVKIKAAAAVAGRVGENWPHVLIIGALVIAAPFIWDIIAANVCNAVPMLKNIAGSGCPTK